MVGDKKMDNVSFIVTARNYSLRYGADGSVRGFVRKWQQKLHRERAIAVNVRGLDGEPVGMPVRGYIHQGQWLAECDACGGHEFVDPNEPVFFCWGCVNRANNGYIRPVEFPADWREIEAAILARPVNDMRGESDLERAGMAQPRVVIRVEAGSVLPLVRSWKPDESLEDVLRQNEVLKGLALGEGVTVVEVRDGVR
jgi:hypothetical protein